MSPYLSIKPCCSGPKPPLEASGRTEKARAECSDVAVGEVLAESSIVQRQGVNGAKCTVCASGRGRGRASLRPGLWQDVACVPGHITSEPGSWTFLEKPMSYLTILS